MMILSTAIVFSVYVVIRSLQCRLYLQTEMQIWYQRLLEKPIACRESCRRQCANTDAGEPTRHDGPVFCL